MNSPLYDTKTSMLIKDYYNNNAKDYFHKTVNLDFDMQRNILLKYLKPNNHILDLGCGSGRDSKAFLDKGYKVTAIDVSKELCKIASEYLSIKVIYKDFNNIKDIEVYDAVWASASLVHIPKLDLINLIHKMSLSIKINGYFYASFKYGDFEGIRDERYYTDLNEGELDEILTSLSNLKLIETKITYDVRQGLETNKWLNIVLKRVKQ